MSPEVREVVLCRDGWACQARERGLEHECFGPINIHHVLMRSQGGTDHPANLVCVCDFAHALIHSKPARSYELGLLQRGGDTICACGHRERFHSVTYGTCTWGRYGLECACQRFEVAA